MIEYNYYEYLKTRSIKGFLYRKLYLYPRLIFFIRGRLLDVGCGIGDMLKTYKNSVGVDINPETVSHCTKIGCTALVMEENILPFVDSTFDTILLDNVIEHIEDPIPLMKEVARVLKSSGSIIIGVPGKKGFDFDPDHKKFYDDLEIDELAKKLNFKIITKFYTPVGIKYLSKLIRQYCQYYVIKLG